MPRTTPCGKVTLKSTVRGTVPLANLTFTTPSPPQLSVTVGSGSLTRALHWPGGALTVRLAGQVRMGGWVSFTVTVKEQLTLLPAPSVAVQVTVVVPTGKVCGGVIT